VLWDCSGQNTKKYCFDQHRESHARKPSSSLNWNSQIICIYTAPAKPPLLTIETIKSWSSIVGVPTADLG